MYTSGGDLHNDLNTANGVQDGVASPQWMDIEALNAISMWCSSKGEKLTAFRSKRIAWKLLSNERNPQVHCLNILLSYIFVLSDWCCSLVTDSMETVSEGKGPRSVLCVQSALRTQCGLYAHDQSTIDCEAQSEGQTYDSVFR